MPKAQFVFAVFSCVVLRFWRFKASRGLLKAVAPCRIGISSYGGFPALFVPKSMFSGPGPGCWHSRKQASGLAGSVAWQWHSGGKSKIPKRRSLKTNIEKSTRFHEKHPLWRSYTKADVIIILRSKLCIIIDFFQLYANDNHRK